MIEKFNDLERYTEQFRNTKKISGLFNVLGSFGIIDGDTEIKRENKKNKTIFSCEVNGVKVQSEYTTYENGVVVRKDCLTNTNRNSVYLRRFFSRFTLEGRDYNIYTQYNGWQHENYGDWQKLVTSVVAESTGSRLLDGATPFMALKNNQSGRISVFNLICNCKWKMIAEIRQIISNYDTVVVETGMDDSGLNMEIKSKETISLPEVIFYECNNDIDFECDKMHEVVNQILPKKSMPILYNTWLAIFDKLDMDVLKKEIDTAKSLGIEAFMIDAGWFGKKGVWSQKLGDWTEDDEGYLQGKLIDISNYCRKQGLIFGLWFEPERASLTSEALKNHPDYFIEKMLLDFANEGARNFELELIAKQIERYKLGWVKLDFNITVPYDKRDSAYYRFYEGYFKFVEGLKERFPNLYITLCGAGGYMAELGAFKYADSYWLTDNQSPDNGVRILKDYIKRIPPKFIERWDVETYTNDIPSSDPTKGKLAHIYCGNANWTRTIGLNKDYMHGFLKGGPMCFSCKLNILPQEYKDELKELISSYKEQREFYLNAVANVLVDRSDLTVFEYSDIVKEKVVVQIFTNAFHQESLTVYPKVNSKFTYKIGEDEIKGERLINEGYKIKQMLSDTCKEIVFIKK